MNDAGLDSGLLRLFDDAQTPIPHSGAFVAATIAKLERARRARLIRRLIGTSVVMIAAAIIAPYVAQITLTTMDRLLDHLPQTGVVLVSPIGGVCAALIAWRIVRRQFN